MIKEAKRHPGLCSYKEIWEEAKEQFFIEDPTINDRYIIRVIAKHAHTYPADKPFESYGTRSKKGKRTKWFYPITVGEQIIASLDDYFLGFSSHPEKVLAGDTSADRLKNENTKLLTDIISQFLTKNIIGYLNGRTGLDYITPPSLNELNSINSSAYTGTYSALKEQLAYYYKFENNAEFEKAYDDIFDSIWHRIIRRDSDFGVTYYLNPEHPTEDSIDMNRFFHVGFLDTIGLDSYDPTGESYDLTEKTYERAHRIYEHLLPRIASHAVLTSLGYTLNEDRLIKDIFRTIDPDNLGPQSLEERRVLNPKNYYEKSKSSEALSAEDASASKDPSQILAILSQQLNVAVNQLTEAKSNCSDIEKIKRIEFFLQDIIDLREDANSLLKDYKA